MIKCNHCGNEINIKDIDDIINFYKSKIAYLKKEQAIYLRKSLIRIDNLNKILKGVRNE